MIDLKNFRCCLENYICMTEKKIRLDVSKRITIERKKKMVIEQTTNGNTKLKRRNVIKIEIIE